MVKKGRFSPPLALFFAFYRFSLTFNPFGSSSRHREVVPPNEDLLFYAKHKYPLVSCCILGLFVAVCPFYHKLLYL